MTTEPLPIYHEVLEHIERTGISNTRFGQLATGDGSLVNKLAKRANMEISTLDKIRAYLDNNQ